jgi:acyl-CoA-binding protein
VVAYLCARNAWQKLGNLPQEEAMQCYIDVLTEVAPSWIQNFEKVPPIS